MFYVLFEDFCICATTQECAATSLRATLTGERRPPVVPLGGTRPETPHPSAFYPPLAAFCPAGIDFPDSRPPFSPLQESASLQSVRNALSGTRAPCQMNQCFGC